MPASSSSDRDMQACRKGEITAVDPLRDPKWDEEVLSHSGATAFHSSAWAKVLTETYGHAPCYFRVADDRGNHGLVPLMEVRSRLTGRRGVCLPFSDFCGPLLFGDLDRDLIVGKLSGLACERNWKHFEVRDAFSETPSLQFYSHRLDLTAGPDALFAGCSSAVRRAVRKAEKSGLKADRAQSWSAVADFYRLHGETRRRHGLPPQPIAFFRNLFSEIIKPGKGFVVRATLGSRCLAAAIFLRFGQTAIYKFGASARALQHFRGSNLVMWEAIRHLAQRDCKILHFGRTSLGNENLRRFKLGWGPAEEIVDYCQWSRSSNAWTKGHDHSSGRHAAIFSRLPLAVNRLAGVLLYPHLD